MSTASRDRAGIAPSVRVPRCESRPRIGVARAPCDSLVRGFGVGIGGACGRGSRAQPKPQTSATSTCRDCGVVRSIREIRTERKASRQDTYVSSQQYLQSRPFDQQPLVGPAISFSWGGETPDAGRCGSGGQPGDAAALCRDQLRDYRPLRRRPLRADRAGGSGRSACRRPGEAGEGALGTVAVARALRALAASIESFGGLAEVYDAVADFRGVIRVRRQSQVSLRDPRAPRENTRAEGTAARGRAPVTRRPGSAR